MKLRLAATLTIGLVTAVLLALLEPVVAASEAGKILFICFLLLLLRSPLWMTGLHSARREGRT